MAFSLDQIESSRQLCRINWPGTPYNRKVVYVTVVEPKVADKAVEKKVLQEIKGAPSLMGHMGRKPLEVLGIDFFKQGRSGQLLTKKDLAAMEMALESGDESVFDQSTKKSEAFLRTKYSETKKELMRKERDFSLPVDGSVQILCNPDARECIFIVACAGAGKSYFAGQYMKSYRNIYPTNPIYLLSKVEEDAAFDGVSGIECVKLNEEFVTAVNEGKIVISEALILFDGKPLFDCR